MVLIYPEFNADLVFLWARENENRITVLCPAMPMVTKCLGRIMRELHQGKTILAWGDPRCIDNLRRRLEASGIATYTYEPEDAMRPVAP
ncbi:MAG: hypothetical protein FJY97_01900 [candidate division Zixibacteria bacterium]|nr:hypothetical protein [candidate division Zixibacteria bacterium]